MLENKKRHQEKVLLSNFRLGQVIHCGFILSISIMLHYKIHESHDQRESRERHQTFVSFLSLYYILSTIARRNSRFHFFVSPNSKNISPLSRYQANILLKCDLSPQTLSVKGQFCALSHRPMEKLLTNYINSQKKICITARYSFMKIVKRMWCIFIKYLG